MIEAIVLFALWAAGLTGCLFMVVAAVLIAAPARLERKTGPQSDAPSPAVTILKPLHGDEVGLFENLVSFCEQDYAGPVQIVFGVESPTDASIAVVERLRIAYPTQKIE